MWLTQRLHPSKEEEADQIKKPQTGRLGGGGRADLELRKRSSHSSLISQTTSKDKHTVTHLIECGKEWVGSKSKAHTTDRTLAPTCTAGTVKHSHSIVC